MKIWIPDHIPAAEVADALSEWIEQYEKYPYQCVIQERINSLYPSTYSPQSMYIANYENKKLVFEMNPEIKSSVHKCPICHEEDRVVRNVLPCNHEFHVHCIDRWLKNNSSCPVCRARI